MSGYMRKDECNFCGKEFEFDLIKVVENGQVVQCPYCNSYQWFEYKIAETKEN